MVRGQKRLAGTSFVMAAAGARREVTVPLSRSTYRLLRRRHRLTLSIAVLFTHESYRDARKTFTITIKAPSHANG